MAGAPKRRRTNGCPPHQHLWPLGALAELICEASSTGSPRVWIDASVPPNAEPYLSIRDTGPGLTPQELRFRLRVTHPLTTWHRNGAYASPWQAAAMRLGADVVILSKHSGGSTYAALLSRTRLAENGPAAIHHPTILLDWSTVTETSSRLSDFLVYTPWSSYQAVCDAFTSMGEQGTLVIIHSLKRNPEDGELELDLRSDRMDIVCINPNDHSEPPARLSRSLRAYLELLFLRPKFRMILRSIPVRPRRLRSMLWGPADFCYTPRARSDLGVIGRDPGRATIRLGFDSKANASEFGMLLYCRGRLIRPYLKVGLQTQVQSGVRVVGIVEAEFVTPTPNMQSFERDKYYQGLMFSLDRSLKIYWARYGTMSKVLEAHSKDPVPKWATCDDCGKWRVVTKHCPTDPLDVTRCPRWVCAMNVGGTVTCGADDDEDMQIITIGKRIPAASRLGPEFATPRRFRSDIREEGFERDDFMRLENASLYRYSRDATSNSMPIRRSSTQSTDMFRTMQMQSTGDGSSAPYFDEAEKYAVQGLTSNTNATTVRSPSQVQATELQIDLDGPMPELFPTGLLELATDDFGTRRGTSLTNREKDNARPMNLPEGMRRDSTAGFETHSPMIKQSLSHNVSLRELTPEDSAVPQTATGKCSTNASTELYPQDESLAGLNNLERKQSTLSSGRGHRNERIDTDSKDPRVDMSDLEPLKSSSSVSREERNERKRSGENLCAKPPLAMNNSRSALHNTVTGDKQFDAPWQKALTGTSTQLLSTDTQGFLSSPRKKLPSTVNLAPEGDQPPSTETHRQSSAVKAANSCADLDENNHAKGGNVEHAQLKANNPAGNTVGANSPVNFDVTDLTPFVKESPQEQAPSQGGSRDKELSVSAPHDLGKAGSCLQDPQSGQIVSPSIPQKCISPESTKRPANRSTTVPPAVQENGDKELSKDNLAFAGSEELVRKSQEAKRASPKRQSQSVSITQHKHATASPVQVTDGQKTEKNSADATEKATRQRSEYVPQSERDCEKKVSASAPSLSGAPLKSKGCDKPGGLNLLNNPAEDEANRAHEFQTSARQEGTPKRRRSAIPEDALQMTPRKRLKDVQDNAQLDIGATISPLQGRSPGGLLGRTRTGTINDAFDGGALEGIQVPRDLFDFEHNAADIRASRGSTTILPAQEDVHLDCAWQLHDPMQLEEALTSPMDNPQTQIPSLNDTLPRAGTPGTHNDTAPNTTVGNPERSNELNIPTSQAAATQVAASAAQAVLSAAARFGGRTDNANGDAGCKLQLSEIAVSATVAAVAAAISATTARRKGPGGSTEAEPISLERPGFEMTPLDVRLATEPSKEDIFRGKLQELISLLTPTGNGGIVSRINDLESLNMAALAKDIEEQQEQKQRDKVRRNMQQEIDSLRASQQAASESLQSIRRSLRIFLDEVVGMSQTDDEHETAEKQFEEYLRLLDVIPQSK